MGFREYQNSPVVISFVFSSVSIPILHESRMCDCAITVRIKAIINNSQPVSCIYEFLRLMIGRKFSKIHGLILQNHT